MTYHITLKHNLKTSCCCEDMQLNHINWYQKCIEDTTPDSYFREKLFKCVTRWAQFSRETHLKEHTSSSLKKQPYSPLIDGWHSIYIAMYLGDIGSQRSYGFNIKIPMHKYCCVAAF